MLIASLFRQSILPKRGETAASRLRALGRDFHPECFNCEVGEQKNILFLTIIEFCRIAIGTWTPRCLDQSVTQSTIDLTVLIAVTRESDNK